MTKYSWISTRRTSTRLTSRQTDGDVPAEEAIIVGGYYSAYGDNDHIDGEGGTDIIDSGPDNDVIYGGSGPDIITGGSGDDEIHGQSGKDTIYADSGADTVYCGGSPGDDAEGGVDTDTDTTPNGDCDIAAQFP